MYIIVHQLLNFQKNRKNIKYIKNTFGFSVPNSSNCIELDLARETVLPFFVLNFIFIFLDK